MRATETALARFQGAASSPINVGDIERLASLAGGSALALYGLTRRTPAGLALTFLGGALIARGMIGRCEVYQTLGFNTAGENSQAGSLLNRPVHVERSVTINRSPEELYRFWRNFENLPAFMKHLKSVEATSAERSHWVASAPLGSSVEWDAEIVEDRPNELIAWRSFADADVTNGGVVRFASAPGDRGAEVHVALDYAAPGGPLGAIFAKLFGEEPSQQIGEDLYRLKAMMEAGEVATIAGQPSGREANAGADHPGDVVAVWGCGPVGQFAIKSAYMLGAERVIAIDRFPERLQMAREQGGAETLDYSEGDTIDRIKELTGGRGPDACIDAVGMEAHGTGMDAFYDRAKQSVMSQTDRPTALRLAIQACRKGGTLSIAGAYVGFIDKVPIGALFNKGLTVKAGQTHVHRYLRPLLERIASGEIDPSFIITHRLRLEDAPKGYAMFKHKDDGCVKVVLKP